VGTFRGRWRSTAVMTAGALVASLCLVAAPAGAATKPTKPTGTLSVEAPGVTVLKKGTGSFAKAKSNQKVGIGDTIQTDASGLAEIKFKDGSLTRLDHDTIFTLDKIVNTTGKRQVESTVSTGQTWNRVQKLSGSEKFEQNGNGATAAVIGTAFVTKCSLPSGTAFKAVKTKKQLKRLKRSSKCDFTLVDGKLTLVSLGKTVGVNRGQSASVDATGNAGDAITVPPDQFYNNEWITTNLALDTQAGIAEVGGTPTAEDLNFARIEGAWTVTLTVTGTTGFRDLAGGSAKTRTYTFTSGPGGLTLTRETANGTRTIPLAFSNGVYSGDDPDLGFQNCELDNGTVSVPNGIKNSGTVSVRASNATAENGWWKATALQGTVTENADQVAGAAGQCRTGAATFELSSSR
jgi:FecR protein